MKRSRLVQSVKDAMRGLSSVFHRERNFRTQIFAAALVILAGIFFGIRRIDWIALIVLILLVLLLEMLNSAAEHFLDVLKPRLNTQIQLIKDMMAGAVLLTAVGAAFIGALIFAQYIIEWIKAAVIH